MRIWILGLTAVLAVMVQTAGAQAPAEKTASPLDLRLIGDSTCAAVVAHPYRMLRSPALEMMPHEVFTAASVKNLGFDAVKIERVQIYVEKPDGNGPPNGVAVYDFVEPIDLAQMLEKIELPIQEAEQDGKKYYQIVDCPFHGAIYSPTNTRIILFTMPLLSRVIPKDQTEAPESKNPLRGVLQSQGAANDALVLVSLDQLREFVVLGMQQIPRVPAPFEPLLEAPDLISMVRVRLNVSNREASGIGLVAHNTEEAEQLSKILKETLESTRQIAVAEISRELAQPGQEDDPVQIATRAYFQRYSDALLASLQPEQKGQLVTLEKKGLAENAQIGVATTGVMTALLLPAVQAARTAARRAQSMNNLKQIVLAMHMHHEAKKRLPGPAILSKDGKPLLSWRVAILPYLGEEDLYKKFHLDEPWDSEHNRKLVGEIPQVFREPSSMNLNIAKTNYLLPTGEGTIFPDAEAPRLKQITDGLSFTIIVVAADDSHAVEWTKPADLAYNPKHPTAGLGQLHPGGFFAGMADGAIRFMGGTVSADLLRKLFTRDGGEVVPGSF